MIKAEIIRETEIEIPKMSETVKVVRITYRVKGYPRRTIWIDKDKYNLENISKLILEDFNNTFGENETEIEVIGLEPTESTGK